MSQCSLISGIKVKFLMMKVIKINIIMTKIICFTKAILT